MRKEREIKKFPYLFPWYVRIWHKIIGKKIKVIWRGNLVVSNFRKKRLDKTLKSGISR